MRLKFKAEVKNANSEHRSFKAKRMKGFPSGTNVEKEELKGIKSWVLTHLAQGRKSVMEAKGRKCHGYVINCLGIK